MAAACRTTNHDADDVTLAKQARSDTNTLLSRPPLTPITKPPMQISPPPHPVPTIPMHPTTTTTTTTSTTSTTTLPPPCPPFLTLPLELLHLILPALPRPALHALTLTHPHLHALLNPALYTLFAPPQLLLKLVNEHTRAGARGQGKLMRPIMMVAGLGDGWREARDGMGWTALMWAARRGDVEVVGVLLSAGCAVSGRNGAGRSVLHLLVMPARVEVRVVRLLLGAGAEVGAVDKLGVSVLEMARRNRNAEVVEALVEARCGKWC